jgi:hypothetical protein
MYKATVRRLSDQYGPAARQNITGRQVVTEWPERSTPSGNSRVWATITETGDVAVHYESALWPVEAHRRKIATSGSPR